MINQAVITATERFNETFSPLAMIEEHGVPIELVETALSDAELASLEQQKLGKA